MSDGFDFKKSNVIARSLLEKLLVNPRDQQLLEQLFKNNNEYQEQLKNLIIRCNISPLPKEELYAVLQYVEGKYYITTAKGTLFSDAADLKSTYNDLERYWKNQVDQDPTGEWISKSYKPIIVKVHVDSIITDYDSIL
jgi:hypothetical protein